MAERPSSPDLKDLQPKQPESKPATVSGPATGDIVLVRQDAHTIIPAIVTNGYEGQNTAGVVAVVTFSAAPYGGSPVNVVANCQPETKDTTAEELTVTYQGYYMPLGSPLMKRDLEKELAAHKEAQTKEAEPAT